MLSVLISIVSLPVALTVFREVILVLLSLVSLLILVLTSGNTFVLATQLTGSSLEDFDNLESSGADGCILDSVFDKLREIVQKPDIDP